MQIANEKDYGHLIDTETFNTNYTNPDMYQIFENKWDWEQRYLHPDYAENFNVANKPKQVGAIYKQIEEIRPVWTESSVEASRQKLQVKKSSIYFLTQLKSKKMPPKRFC